MSVQAQLVTYEGTINLNDGDTIKDKVFDNGHLLTSYRILPSTKISDLPASLRGNSSYYLFIVKISYFMALAMNSGGKLFKILYLNNIVSYKELEFKNVTQ